MKLKNIIDIVPGGLMDHIRVYADNKKIDKFYNYLDCTVTTIAPALKNKLCPVSSVYDAYLDIFINASDELPF